MHLHVSAQMDNSFHDPNEYVSPGSSLYGAYMCLLFTFIIFVPFLSPLRKLLSPLMSSSFVKINIISSVKVRRSNVSRQGGDK